MDQRTEIREFLASRRARVTPAEVGLPVVPGQRRVPGLRREEVALLAGVSVDYYARLERGQLAGVSDSVLEALARALRLDVPERAHLFALARHAATGAPRPPQRTAVALRPGVARMLDAMADAPAFVRNGRFDVLGANQLGRALYAPVFERNGTPPNSARFTFLDPRATEFFGDWERAASDVVSVLHGEAGRHPDDAALSALVDELAARSDRFRELWATHDVRFHDTGVKTLNHPVVGTVTLTFEVLDLRADPGLAMFVYGAEPGSPAADALNLMASWAATPEREDAERP